jgi:phenylacetate-CoA ligase
MDLNKIYHLLPVPLQNIGITLFGLHWYNRRFGGIFKKEYNSCKEREFYTLAQWRDYQNNELQKILLHSFKTVPYYQKLLKEKRITENELHKFSIDDLTKIPLLEKDTFRQLGLTELVSTQLEANCEFYGSSGSTGKPTKTMYSKNMHQKYFAIFETYINNWAGIDYKVPRGVIGGRRIIQDGVSKGPFYRYNYIEKQTYFSAYHISANTVENYLKGMIDNKVEYMTGYASANYFLARFIEEAGLKAPQLKAVLTSSEKLTDEMRNTFRRVYGCEAFDSYNGVECCNLISECEKGTLHIVPDVGIVEVINPDGSATQPGEIGEIISTGLLNYNQPLIRYRMGDLVKISKNQHCECGRNMVVVDEIVGRMEDTVTGPDGRQMVRFHGIFIGIPNIIESQVIQHKINEFEIKLVVSDALNEEHFNLIRKKMDSQLGAIQLKINVVDEIPRNANGKFKSVVSFVK